MGEDLVRRLLAYAGSHSRDPTLVEEAVAEIARLREALTEIEGSAAPDHWVPQYQHCVDAAIRALAEKGGA